jgi:hypothetical protein
MVKFKAIGILMINIIVKKINTNVSFEIETNKTIQNQIIKIIAIEIYSKINFSLPPIT